MVTFTAHSRSARSSADDVADAKLSEWTQAYRRLKIEQALVKAAGPSATRQMRSDLDRLQRTAEKALQALTAHSNASRREQSQAKPREAGCAA